MSSVLTTEQRRRHRRSMVHPPPTQLFLSTEPRARAWPSLATLRTRATRAARTPGRQGFLRSAALSSNDERQRERTRALSNERPRHPAPSDVRSSSASSEPRDVAIERAEVELRAAPSRVQQRTVRLLQSFGMQMCDAHIHSDSLIHTHERPGR